MDRYLNCQEVANRYGVKLITVWDWIRKKKLPAIKLGRDYRIRPEDLEQFEEERCTVRSHPRCPIKRTGKEASP